MTITATTMSDENGKQYHIGCGKGDLAEMIILVGDPERAEKVARRFDEVRQTRKHREYVTITGTRNGREISVMATGIGQDNTEIAVVEICQITSNPTLVRCGSSGALQPEIELGSLVISTGAVRLENTTHYFVHEGYPALADNEVILALKAACFNKNHVFHTGITASTSSFYGAQARDIPGFPARFPDLKDELKRMNVKNFEMETATLFTLAQMRGIRAGAVCAVYSNRPKNVAVNNKERNIAESNCIEVALEAAEKLAWMDDQKRETKQVHWIPKELC